MVLSVRVHLCGVRGSIPATGRDFLRYGGQTSCVAHRPRRRASAAGSSWDAGTGLRPATVAAGAAGRSPARSCSRTDWDHVHGLPFFAAGDRPDARVTLLLPEQGSTGQGGTGQGGTGQGGPASAEAVLARGMSPPHFPITPGELRGSVAFGFLTPGRDQGRGLHGGGGPRSRTRAAGPSGTGSATGIRCWPTRPTTAPLTGAGPEGWGEYHPAALALAAVGRTRSIHDAFLLPQELAAQAFLGHAAADYAVGLGPPGRGPAGSSWPTTSPTAPTRSWTCSPRASGPTRT